MTKRGTGSRRRGSQMGTLLQILDAVWDDSEGKVMNIVPSGLCMAGSLVVVYLGLDDIPRDPGLLILGVMLFIVSTSVVLSHVLGQGPRGKRRLSLSGSRWG